MNRISELPQPILHRILYFLSQYEAARTSILSKAWRHTWSTRPNIEFREDSFEGTQQTFVSIVNKALQVYHDQKLCLEEFVVEISTQTSESVLLLNKWIPIIMMYMGVQKFHLHTLCDSSPYDLPRAVFKAQSLQHLYLGGCMLDQIKAPNYSILLKNLKTLWLNEVYIENETFQKIISSCPLIEDMCLQRCEGLIAIKVNKLYNLKKFEFTRSYKNYVARVSSIEMDEVPNLETVQIDNSTNWLHYHRKFSNLKSLSLSWVRLSETSFDYFSCDNFRSLEKLILDHCFGFEEFQLRSHTIKHFSFMGGGDMPIKPTIDAPNLLYFEYRGKFPKSLSLTRILSERWESYIDAYLSFFDDISSWFLKLSEMLKALSTSQISLCISQLPKWNINDFTDGLVRQWNHAHGQIIDNNPLVMVECLRLSCDPSIYLDFLNGCSRILRPIKIENWWFTTVDQNSLEWQQAWSCNEIADQLLRKSLKERDNGNGKFKFWQRNLEQVSMEMLNESREKWLPFQGTSLPECAAWSSNQEMKPLKIRFRLKWREI